MEKYDVVVVGGGIAGSVAAKFSAQKGFSTLLLEKCQTPRNKTCSGIQFPYMGRLIGEKIPREVLCENELSRVEMVLPSGKTVRGRMKMLNFWRSTFDSWLNTVAVRGGAHFCDDCRLLDVEVEKAGIGLQVQQGDRKRSISTRYLVAADGYDSSVRRNLRPQDFAGKASGATLNYYIAGDAKMDPNALYMFYDRDFSPLMFAWVYQKDGQWVVGTGADAHLLDYAQRFLGHVRAKYSLRGKILREEVFTSPMDTTVFLGNGHILMTGDAAGLVDLYRGLGMDNAALSARLAVKAIIRSSQTGKPPIESYRRLTGRIWRKMERNAKRQATRYATNETLERSLSLPRLARDGVFMLAAAQANRVLPPERIIMLPL